MNKRIGLCGSHRTGKTTLAQKLAEYHQVSFIESSVSEVFKQCGRQQPLKPDDKMDFSTRLWIQQQILDAAEHWWLQPTDFITDRTPLDFIAYILCDIQGTTEVDFKALTKYLDRCFTVTNQIFSHIVIVQPGIPLVYAEGKAALNQAYIEHLNTVILGLCHDSRLCCPVTVLRREVIDLKQRLIAASQF